MLRDGTFVTPAVVARVSRPKCHVTLRSAGEPWGVADGRQSMADDRLSPACGQPQEAGDTPNLLDGSLWEACGLQYRVGGRSLVEDGR